ncbi:hypothetical protein M758_6G023700 [Ceratodon purpureus]|uniref:Uncharacterized protein n=1 Tax=Ceratodon purpureus TaxID=3225 RepID=A0A8T0HE46_CERPU|nr:hypothetical protein KC19_6G026500 [Ceratodon purpureus]KAG0612390.1 hypothetical protein M758_6G023700 [Ceratodon purpureus]
MIRFSTFFLSILIQSHASALKLCASKMHIVSATISITYCNPSNSTAMQTLNSLT